MKVNISVSFDVVEDAFAWQNSVDLADLEASGMGPEEAAGAVMATIEHDARKGRAKHVACKERPATASVGTDYPLDPDQD